MQKIAFFKIISRLKPKNRLLRKMRTLTNLADERATKKIIEVLSGLDQNDIEKLAEDSGIPVQRIKGVIDNVEELSLLDKGKLIEPLIKLTDS